MDILSNLSASFFAGSQSLSKTIKTPLVIQRAFKGATAIPGLFHGLYDQESEKAGVLVTEELQKAIDHCTAEVDRISKACRARNRKFRDTEFDLEYDQDLCLHGLNPGFECHSPADVRRVTDIFDKPEFYIDGIGAGDVVQGDLGDCWFLSALAIMSTSSGLLEKCCVKRDEKVGVYGFIFFRNKSWVSVIVDDLLYTKIRKYEDLTYHEQQLYHKDKKRYNDQARKGSKTLYFASSGTQGETWVPLIEKAYAKLHGNYSYLSGGQAGEAIEDMTGGVNTFINIKDILDTDEFWTNELMNANKDRLFGCSFEEGLSVTKEGLKGNHAYSILRAVEFRGKRFLVIRNPWGHSEWTGRWSDGAKEWTQEGGWLDALSVLKHGFGDDGEFVMEYSDFLQTWERLNRILIFDSSWVLSTHWLNVKGRPMPSAWSYGDASYTIKVPATTKAIIALSRVDDRYFQDLIGRSSWFFDFALFKAGSPEPIAISDNSYTLGVRSVNIEVQLEEGEYVVHVRLDRRLSGEVEWFKKGLETWDERKLARVLMQRAQSISLAQNFDPSTEAVHLPLPLQLVAGQDISTLEKKAKEAVEAKLKEVEDDDEEKEAKVTSPTTTTETISTTTTTTVTATGGKPAVEGDRAEAVEGEAEEDETKKEEVKEPESEAKEEVRGGGKKEAKDDDEGTEESDEESDRPLYYDDEGTEESDEESDRPPYPYPEPYPCSYPHPYPYPYPWPFPPPVPQGPPPYTISDDHVVLGLSVYTHKDAPVTITGQVRSDDSRVMPGLGGLALAGDPVAKPSQATPNNTKFRPDGVTAFRTSSKRSKPSRN